MVHGKYYSKCSEPLISLYGFVGIRNYAIIYEDYALLGKFKLRKSMAQKVFVMITNCEVKFIKLVHEYTEYFYT